MYLYSSALVLKSFVLLLHFEYKLMWAITRITDREVWCCDKNVLFML